MLAPELGVAGALRGDLQSVAAGVEAPALLPLRRRYHLSGGGLLGPGGARTLVVGAVDSATGPVAGALYGRWTWTDRPATGDELPGWKAPDEDLSNPTEDRLLAAALGGAAADGHLGLAAGVRWRRRAPTWGEVEDAVTGLVSVAARPAEPVVCSLTVAGLAPGDGPGPELGLGLGWSPAERVVLLADGTWTAEDGAGWAVGLRARPWGPLALRAGGAGGAGGPSAALGLGVGDRRAAIDYGVRAALGGEAPELEHALTALVAF